jgi:hypothetical protein
MNTTYENGQMTVKQENEFTYILAPKRKGVLEIPALSLSVGSKEYKTQVAKIQVDEVAIGANSPRPPPRPAPMPIPRAPTFPDPNSPWGPGVGGLPRDLQDTLQDTYDFAIPGEGRQTFFVKAHVKRTNVFVGEMIEVSYRAYTKTRSLREPEITKFPEFKGFLKEDLHFPKIFDPQPVMIGGQSFFETELVRYALYPLREGSLKIDQMNFKLRISNRDSLAESLLYGTPFDGNLGPDIPMQKSSESVQVIVKPLPIPKPDSFTGAVGQFVMETLSPPKSVKTGQPFSMIINIEGIGNLRSIEAPKVAFPKELDLTNMASHPSSIEKDGSGTIQFEYLLNPREVGEVQIAESEWAYFDPSKAEYVKLTIPAIPLSITQGTGAQNLAGGAGEKSVSQKKREWQPLAEPASNIKTVKLASIGAPMIWASQPAFALHLLTLVVFLGALWRRRQREARDVYLKTYPWTHLEEEFTANQKFSSKKLAEKLDLWTRLRLIGYFKAAGIDHHLHSESSRNDFAEVLKSNLSPEHFKIIDTIKGFWTELDKLRFTGTSTDSEIASRSPFDKARAALGQVEKSLRKVDKKLYQGFQDEWTSN